MIYPPLNELMKKTGSRYSLVIATAKRAREITAGSDSLVKCETDKPVSIAINEIFEDKIIVTDKNTVVVQKIMPNPQYNIGFENEADDES